MRKSLLVASALAAAALCCSGVARRADALAGTNDYTLTTLSGLWEAPPVDATTVGFGTSFDAKKFTLPFSFRLFGETVVDAWITNQGYVQFGPTTKPYQEAGNQNFTGASSPGPSFHGVIAPLWDNLSSQGGAGSVQHWTVGTAPNRRWVVAWIDYGEVSTPTSRYQFEAKIYEGTFRIEFAFKPDTIPSTWTGATWSQGINSPSNTDSRYVCPLNGGLTNTGHPPADYRFDPRFVDYSGRVVFDRIVPTASGIGTTPTTSSFGGARIDLRRGTTTLDTTFADADGNFAFHLPSGHAIQMGTMYALTESPGCVVKDPAAAGAYEFALTPDFSLQNTIALGTMSVTQAADALAAWRAPANIARAIHQVWAWAADRTSDPVPQLQVWYDTASTVATNYTRENGLVPTYLRVAGPAAANSDMWDDPVIQRTFGRHVLGSIALPVPAQTPYVDTFDAPIGEPTAFAEGFGYWIGAAVSGNRVFVDATSASTAITRDLEDPQPVSAKGKNVAAWVAAALFDLADAANESHDWTDGTGAESDRPLAAAAAITALPSVDLFARAWSVSSGFPAGALSRDFLHHGLVTDDALEPNDEGAEAADLGAVPLRRTGLVLSFGAEDWFTVDSPGSPLGLVAEMTYNRTASPADIQLQIVGPGGQVLADRLETGFGLVTAATGPIAAGTYRVRVRHASGELVPAYVLQVTNRLEVPVNSLPSWTVGRPYSQPFTLAGGTPPYTFITTPPNGQPTGISVNTATQLVTGTPTAVGVYDFDVTVRDAAVPPHEATGSQKVTINAEVDLGLGDLIAFPGGHTVPAGPHNTGGTAPQTFALTAGALPTGVTLRADALVFEGTAAAVGSGRFTIDGADVAGSTASADVLGVVCGGSPEGHAEMTLAAGDSGCGFSFDAVAGSTVSVGIAAAKKQAKRTLRGAILAPDGTTAVLGGKEKTALGKWTASGVVCPVTGRYFVVVGSADGVDAQMLGSVRITLPKSGKAAPGEITRGDRVSFEIGALAGAKLTLKATPDKKSDLQLAVQTLVDPTGSFVPPGAAATTVGKGVALSIVLPKGGTWTIVLSAVNGTGKLSYSYKIAQPKGGVFVAD